MLLSSLLCMCSLTFQISSPVIFEILIWLMLQMESINYLPWPLWPQWLALFNKLISLSRWMLSLTGVSLCVLCKIAVASWCLTGHAVSPDTEYLWGDIFPLTFLLRVMLLQFIPIRFWWLYLWIWQASGWQANATDEIPLIKKILILATTQKSPQVEIRS